MQILFMAGFLIGMILPDIAWKMEWHQEDDLCKCTFSGVLVAGSEAGVSTASAGDERKCLSPRGQPVESCFEYRFAVAGSMYLELK